MKKKSKFKLSIWQFLALGYLAVIFVGSVLLILPFATKSGNSTSYLNALFTAVSSASTTGLAPYDTATHWTLFGQIVILLMIQFGGLGFMTTVSVIFTMFKHGMSMYSKSALMKDSGATYSNGIVTLIKRIIIGTVVCECAGAILLSIQFIGDFGWGKGIYYSVFHAISAFCNAGFDLFGTVGNEFVSVTGYSGNPLVILTLSALIILGGLGFCVWGDIIDCKFRFKKFQLNTQVVLIVNCILITLGTVLFLVFERNSAAFQNMDFGERLLLAFLLSVSPRSCGFAACDAANLSQSGFLLTVVLMFIGGSSGSTAGGIRVGTFTIIVIGMLGVFRGKRDLNLGKKRLDYSQLSKALAVFTACLTMITVSTITLSALEPDISFKASLFECVSALTTAGLSLSLTPVLGVASRIIIMILMYIGRIGILTFALALGEKKTLSEIRKPLDSILIG